MQDSWLKLQTAEYNKVRVYTQDRGQRLAVRLDMMRIFGRDVWQTRQAWVERNSAGLILRACMPSLCSGSNAYRDYVMPGTHETIAARMLMVPRAGFRGSVISGRYNDGYWVFRRDEVPNVAYDSGVLRGEAATYPDRIRMLVLGVHMLSSLEWDEAEDAVLELLGLGELTEVDLVWKKAMAQNSAVHAARFAIANMPIAI